MRQITKDQLVKIRNQYAEYPGIDFLDRPEAVETVNRCIIFLTATIQPAKGFRLINEIRCCFELFNRETFPDAHLYLGKMHVLAALAFLGYEVKNTHTHYFSVRAKWQKGITPPVSLSGPLKPKLAARIAEVLRAS